MKSVLSLGVACPVVAAASVLLALPTAHAQVAAMRAEKERSAQEEAAQRTREEEARRLGESIVDLRQALTGRAFDPGFRETVKRELLGVPLEALREIEGGGARGDLRAAIDAAGSRGATHEGGEEDMLLLPTRVSEPSAVSGVAQTGSVFVPVTPCRIIDTRLTAAGALVPGGARSFVVSGSSATLFGAQGGSATGCGIPTGAAVSAFVNFVAVSPSGAGNLRTWAYSAAPPPPPLAAILNYASISGLAIANGVTAPLCDPLATTCTYDILVQAFGSDTHVVADVMGYFRPALTSFAVSTRITAATIVQSSCTPYAGAVIAINAPAAGKVLVRANVQLEIDHTVGQVDSLRVGIGASSVDCSFPLGDAAAIVMGPEPTGLYYPTVPTSRLFTISTPGFYFYFVNGFTASAVNDRFWTAGVQATFYPD